MAALCHKPPPETIGFNLSFNSSVLRACRGAAIAIAPVVGINF